MSEQSTGDAIDSVERDYRTARALMDIQLTNRKAARLLRRVLAADPDNTDARYWLGVFHVATDDPVQARRLMLEVIGKHDHLFASAARVMRDMEFEEHNYDAGLEWATAAMKADPHWWNSLMGLGLLTGMSGGLEVGWQMIDDAVDLCVRTSPDMLPRALRYRTVCLLDTFAPPDRVGTAAEEAFRANPADEVMGSVLSWAYATLGRFADAEATARRVLRIDPTDEIPQITLRFLQEVQDAIDKHPTLTLDESGAALMMTKFWSEQRGAVTGTDLASALNALRKVMPRELVRALHVGLSKRKAAMAASEPTIARWRDGQDRGTAEAWGPGFRFRLMSSSEVTAMDDAIEADPAAYPQWANEERLTDYYCQVMTDDAGGYIVDTLDGVVLRREGVADERVADSLADWFWDRVVAFGGDDPRPRTRPTKMENERS